MLNNPEFVAFWVPHIRSPRDFIILTQDSLFIIISEILL